MRTAPEAETVTFQLNPALPPASGSVETNCKPGWPTPNNLPRNAEGTRYAKALLKSTLRTSLNWAPDAKSGALYAATKRDS